MALKAVRPKLKKSKQINKSDKVANKSKNKGSENYLDYVFKRSDKYRWEKDDKGACTIFIENRGVFNRIAQKLLKKPKVSQLHLEEMGSFIWPLIDGEKSVYDIGQLVKEAFGEKAEPLYPRLAKYIQMLDAYGFIEKKDEL